MPRGKANQLYSQLSVVIPRAIHRAAKTKARRSGVPSFSAYVAVVLEAAADLMSTTDVGRARMIEQELKAHEGASQS
jgi:hypothetical protein